MADSSRRQFLQRSCALAGAALGAHTLALLNAHKAWALEHPGSAASTARPSRSGYRPLVRIPDQRGVEVLALPQGFEYVTFGHTGAPFVDGSGAHPRSHDGMGAFAGPGGTVRLVRNHELRLRPGDFTYGVVGDPTRRYDPLAMGGTVTIDYDPSARRVVREQVSLNGTMVNCSGGLAYRDAGWLSCEETIVGREQGWTGPHGYTFFVPVERDSSQPAMPMRALGRFRKEAAVADTISGIVYQTEDDGSASGFYRFLPKDPANLDRGGTLQMLAIAGRRNYDARDGQTTGAALPVEWVTIGDPDPDLEAGARSCFGQGFALGGARFHRLEGIYRGDAGSMYFVSTSGGDAKTGAVTQTGFRTGYGQLWQYIPDGRGGTLMLVYESTSGAVLDSPDNLCVTPRGGILFCEDDASGMDRDTHPLAPGVVNVNRLVALTREGAPFTFAVNVLNSTELAGACFSPDGTILFVNLFGVGREASGMTCAITGPWNDGGL